MTSNLQSNMSLRFHHQPESIYSAALCSPGASMYQASVDRLFQQTLARPGATGAGMASMASACPHDTKLYCSACNECSRGLSCINMQSTSWHSENCGNSGGISALQHTAPHSTLRMPLEGFALYMSLLHTLDAMNASCGL